MRFDGLIADANREEHETPAQLRAARRFVTEVEKQDDLDFRLELLEMARKRNNCDALRREAQAGIIRHFDTLITHANREIDGTPEEAAAVRNFVTSARNLKDDSLRLQLFIKASEDNIGQSGLLRREAFNNIWTFYDADILQQEYINALLYVVRSSPSSNSSSDLLFTAKENAAGMLLVYVDRMDSFEQKANALLTMALFCDRPYQKNMATSAWDELVNHSSVPPEKRHSLLTQAMDAADSQSDLFKIAEAKRAELIHQYGDFAPSRLTSHGPRRALLSLFQLVG